MRHTLWVAGMLLVSAQTSAQQLDAEDRALIQQLNELGKEFGSLDKLRGLNLPSIMPRVPDDYPLPDFPEIPGLPRAGPVMPFPLPGQLSECLASTRVILGTWAGILYGSSDKLKPGAPTSAVNAALEVRTRTVAEFMPWAGPPDLVFSPEEEDDVDGDPRRQRRKANSGIVGAASEHGRYLDLNADIVVRVVALREATGTLGTKWNAIDPAAAAPNRVHAMVFRSEACASEFASNPRNAYTELERVYGPYLFYDALEAVLRGISPPFGIVVPSGVPYCAAHEFAPACSSWRDQLENPACFGFELTPRAGTGPIIGIPSHPGVSRYPVAGTGCDEDRWAYLRPFFTLEMGDAVSLESSRASVAALAAALPETRERFVHAFSSHGERFSPQLRTLTQRLREEKGQLEEWARINGEEAKRLATESYWLARRAAELNSLRARIADQAAERERLEAAIEAAFARLELAEEEASGGDRAIDKHADLIDRLVSTCLGDSPAPECADPQARARIDRQLYEAYERMRQLRGEMRKARQAVSAIRDEIGVARKRIAELRESHPALRERYSTGSFERQSRYEQYTKDLTHHESEVSLHGELLTWFDDDMEIVEAVEKALAREL